MKRRGDKPAVDCLSQFLYNCGSREPRYSKVENHERTVPTTSAGVSSRKSGTLVSIARFVDIGVADDFEIRAHNVAMYRMVRGDGPGIHVEEGSSETRSKIGLDRDGEAFS